MDTTKKTNSRSDLYSTYRPPEAPKKQTPVRADGKVKGPICPFQAKQCLRDRCAIWSDTREMCSFSSDNLYNDMRDAFTDSIVDIITNYDTNRRSDI